MDAEIGVIGLGTMGSMALWQLAKKNVSVIGFEQFGFGHDYSAAGGESRIFRTAYGEGDEYVPLLQSAKKEWHELEKESGSKLLELNGALSIGNRNTRFIKNVLKSIELYNLPYKLYNHEEARFHYPQHNISSDEIIILDKQGGFIHPELSILSAIKSAEKHGAKAYSHSKVKRIGRVGEKIQVSIDSNTFNFNKVIITTGPWLGNFFPAINEKSVVKRLGLAWFMPYDIDFFKKEQFPTFIHDHPEGTFYGTPTIDGNLVKMAIFKNFGLVKNPYNLNRTLTTSDTLSLRNLVGKHINGLYPDPIRVDTYMDMFTEDEHSVIGKIPRDEKIILAGGFSGHGFIIGKLLTDLALDEKLSISIDHLAVNRFQYKE